MPAKKRAPAAVQLALEDARPRKAPAKKTAGRRPRRAAAPRGAEAPREDPPADLAAVAQALARVGEGLHFTQESFAQALLRLPRAEDYEPLNETLRRLAGATPALLAAIESRARTTDPLDLADLEAPLRPASAEGVAEAIASAREHLEAALESLPTAADYEPAARNLREMATVSPSLLAWLGEVPPLATPLAESVAGLRQALRALERAERALGRSKPATQTAAVKVVVRG